MSLASQPPRQQSRGQIANAEFDLPALGAALWRKKWRILGPTIFVALVTLGIVQLITPRYLSEARVIVEGRENIYLRPDADKDLDRTVDEQAVMSQAQLILSRDLAREVIDKLKLSERPEFDPALAGISPIKSVLGILGLTKNPMSMTPQERVLEAYYDRLSVYPVDRSRVIVIDFSSEDPELAARVANAIADAYLVRQRQAKQQQAGVAAQYLSGEIDGMRKRVADAEAKVETFRAKTNLLIGNNNTTLSAQQLGDVNAQLAAGRSQQADAEARAKMIRDMLRSGKPIESSDILNSELIRRLSEQRVTLRAQLAEQSSSLLDGHPRIKELKAQIADLDGQIRAEAETVARSFENDAKLAGARVDSQVASLNQLKQQAATTNGQDVELRSLEREAKAQRDLLESYLAKYREATARDTPNSAPADARVISQAAASNVPAYPKKLPTVVIATLATFMLCCGFVVSKELLAAPMHVPANPVVRRTSVAETLSPRVAVVGDETRSYDSPEIASREFGRRDHAAHDYHEYEVGREGREGETAQVVGIPISAIEDVAYSLRHSGASGAKIAVLGAGRGLDASRSALKLARALAADTRVILVGLDSTQGGGINAVSNDPSAAGLAELATGAASFRDIITRDKSSRLNLISSGRAATDRFEILSAPTIAPSFDALARSYHHVVIDAGAADGPELEAIAEIAPHAVVVAATTSSAAPARERLLDAGFDDVTILVGTDGAGAAEAAAA